MKSRQQYPNGIPIPTDYNPNFGYCYAIVRIPNSQSWKAIIRGLYYPLMRYYTWRLDREIAHNTIIKSREIFWSLEFTCMLDHNLTELNYTLKHILAHLSNRSTIDTHIAKPAFAYNEDGSINHNINNTISIPDKSVFKVKSLLEENNVAEVLQIAFLDDSTIQLPDLNPFNLESKIDTLNTNIEQHNTILNYFSQAFYGGISSDWNPLFSENFFTRFSKTFNSLNLFGMVSRSFYDSHVTLNQNLSTSFNESYSESTYLASNSYFRLLHTWLNSDWKLFHDVMVDMKDCICAIPTAISNLDLSPIINVYNTNNNPITIENINDTSNTTNNTTTTTTTTTVTNPDGSTTTINNTETVINYPPIDPTDPQNTTTTQPYSTVKITQSNSHDAICGFIYYTMSQLADWIEWLIEWLNPLTTIMKAMGIASWATQVQAYLDKWGNVYVAKLESSVLRGMGAKWLGLAGFAVDFIPDYIREIRDDLACPANDDFTGWNISSFKQEIVNKLQLLTGEQAILDFVSYLIYTFYDYGLWSPVVSMTNINMADYAQYCPCPLQGDFVAFWVRYVSNSDEEITISSQTETTISGTRKHGNIDTPGTYYLSSITGTININNPLSADCIVTETSWYNSQTGQGGSSNATYNMTLTLVNNKVNLQINTQINLLSKA